MGERKQTARPPLGDLVGWKPCNGCRKTTLDRLEFEGFRLAVCPECAALWQASRFPHDWIHEAEEAIREAVRSLRRGAGEVGAVHLIALRRVEGTVARLIRTYLEHEQRDETEQALDDLAVMVVSLTRSVQSTPDGLRPWPDRRDVEGSRSRIFARASRAISAAKEQGQ